MYQFLSSAFTFSAFSLMVWVFVLMVFIAACVSYLLQTMLSKLQKNVSGSIVKLLLIVTLILTCLCIQFQLAWKRLLGVHVTVDTSHDVDGEHTSGTSTKNALEGTPSARIKGPKFLSFIFKVPDHVSVQSLSRCAATTVTTGTLHEVKECSGPGRRQLYLISYFIFKVKERTQAFNIFAALLESQEKGEASPMREGQEVPVAVEQREIRDDVQSNSFQESKVE